MVVSQYGSNIMCRCAVTALPPGPVTLKGQLPLQLFTRFWRQRTGQRCYYFAGRLSAGAYCVAITKVYHKGMPTLWISAAAVQVCVLQAYPVCFTDHRFAAADCA